MFILLILILGKYHASGKFFGLHFCIGVRRLVINKAGRFRRRSNFVRELSAVVNRSSIFNFPSEFQVPSFRISASILYISTEAKTFQYNGHFYIVHNSIKYLNHSLSLIECNQKYGASFLVFNTEDEYKKSMKALSSIYMSNALPELTWIGGFTDEAKSATLNYSSYNSENGEH